MDVMCILSLFGISTTLHMEFEYSQRYVFQFFTSFFQTAHWVCSPSMYKILSKRNPVSQHWIKFSYMVGCCCTCNDWVRYFVSHFWRIELSVSSDIPDNSFMRFNSNLCKLLFIHFISLLTSVSLSENKANSMLYYRNVRNMRCGWVHTDSNEVFFISYTSAISLDRSNEIFFLNS